MPKPKPVYLAGLHISIKEQFAPVNPDSCIYLKFVKLIKCQRDKLLYDGKKYINEQEAYFKCIRHYKKFRHYINRCLELTSFRIIIRLCECMNHMTLFEKKINFIIDNCSSAIYSYTFRECLFWLICVHEDKHPALIKKMFKLRNCEEIIIGHEYRLRGSYFRVLDFSLFICKLTPILTIITKQMRFAYRKAHNNCLFLFDFI